MIEVVKKDEKFFVNGVECGFVDDGKGTKWLKLPQNDLNRKWISEKVLAKVEFPYVITEAKAPRAPKAQENTPSWEDFLEEEEKKIIEDLKAKCEARMKESTKKSLMDQIAALKAQLKSL